MDPRYRHVPGSSQGGSTATRCSVDQVTSRPPKRAPAQRSQAPSGPSTRVVTRRRSRLCPSMPGHGTSWRQWPVLVPPSTPWPMPGRPGNTFGPLVEDVFDRIDTNHDGVIQRSEWAEAQAGSPSGLWWPIWGSKSLNQSKSCVFMSFQVLFS